MGSGIYQGTWHILVFGEFHRCKDESIQRKMPTRKQPLYRNVSLVLRKLGVHHDHYVDVAVVCCTTLGVGSEQKYLQRVNTFDDSVAQRFNIFGCQHALAFSNCSARCPNPACYEVYLSPSTSCMSQTPGLALTTHLAARTEPLENMSRVWARWVISMRSPMPMK